MSQELLRLYNHVLGPEFKLRSSGKNATGICPFCDHNTFSVSLDKGTGRCWNNDCKVSCNPTSFITRYHEAWLDHTPDEYYQELEEARGISWKVFKKARFAWDDNNQRWLVPYHNESTKFLRNLGNFTVDGEKPYTIYVLPNVNDTFPKGFYNPGTFPFQPGKNKSVIICEGEWDALALIDMMDKEGIPEAERPAILGSPGASIIPKNASNTLIKYKKITLYYDNDNPGQEGMLKFAAFLSAEGYEVSFLNWKEMKGDFEGYDVRDVLTKAKKSFSFLQENTKVLEIEASKPERELGPGFISTVEGIDPVESLDEYLDLYQEHMTLTETNKKAIITTMAVVSSNPLPGEPLWFFLIGPASSGKTTLIESFGGSHEWCNYASKLTAKSLVSGWAAGDCSLVNEMTDKCFFIKDFTVVLGMSKDQQKELFDTLRDIYDGSIKFTYGNGQVRDIQNIKFNLVAGVTPAIYKVKTSELGDRFLRLDYAGDEPASDEALMTAIGNYGRTTEKKNDLTRASIGYLKFIKNNYYDNASLPALATIDKKMVAQLAKYVAFVRTNPEYHRTEGLLYRPKPEDPPRLGLQFTKLCYSTVRTLNPTHNVRGTLRLNDLSRELMAKVAYDTCYGFGQDILKVLYHNPKMSENQLSKKLSLPVTRIHRVLNDLKATKIVNYTLKYTQGRPAHMYYLDSGISELSSILFGDKETSDAESPQEN